MKGLIDFIKGCLVLFLAFWIIMNLSKNTKTPDHQATDSPPTTIKTDIPSKPSCKTDWKLCKDNSEMANNYNQWSLAAVKCHYAANDKARYGNPSWPWISFESYNVGDDFPKIGQAVLIEKNAQFQNQFGAMTHVSVYCTFNLETNEVMDIHIIPR